VFRRGCLLCACGVVRQGVVTSLSLSPDRRAPARHRLRSPERAVKGPASHHREGRARPSGRGLHGVRAGADQGPPPAQQVQPVDAPQDRGTRRAVGDVLRHSVCGV
jgi:hypothetical protein